MFMSRFFYFFLKVDNNKLHDHKDKRTQKQPSKMINDRKQIKDDDSDHSSAILLIEDETEDRRTPKRWSKPWISNKVMFPNFNSGTKLVSRFDPIITLTHLNVLSIHIFSSSSFKSNQTYISITF